MRHLEPHRFPLAHLDLLLLSLNHFPIQILQVNAFSQAIGLVEGEAHELLVGFQQVGDVFCLIEDGAGGREAGGVVRLQIRGGCIRRHELGIAHKQQVAADLILHL